MSLELSVSHIIHVVLDEIFYLTQIDPTFISPDDSLETHLGLERKATCELLERAAHKLQIPMSQDDLKTGSSDIFSLRDLVDHLQDCYSKHASQIDAA